MRDLTLPKKRSYQKWLEASRHRPQANLPKSGPFIVITGCPRSGTRYISCVLQYLGKDVRHEYLGTNGVASAGIAAAASRKLFMGHTRAFSAYTPKQVARAATVLLHQVRHPLDFLASAAQNLDGFWDDVGKIIPHGQKDPPLLRAAKYWYHWNVLAEKLCQWTYRVEALSNLFDEFCRRTGARHDRSVFGTIPTNVGADMGVWYKLKRVRVTWNNISALDRILCRKIRAKATEYGYE